MRTPSNPVNVGIRAEGGTWIKDPGNYDSYAGPVHLKAAGKCVQYMGSTRWWSSSLRTVGPGGGHPPRGPTVVSPRSSTR
ncbi:hypothetical protein ACWD3I_30980 [Streptomyces sp. NPDC002817]|uniref:hypothetical protein n=1 Tax=Streptomyces sp. NPDC088357 TaxID=3154655 RepID=UPI0034418A6C